MTSRVLRQTAGTFVILGLWAVQASVQPASPGNAEHPIIILAEVDSIIQPVSAEFMIETIDQAEADHAALVVFTLRTPGGLVDSTRSVVTRMLAAPMPVAIFVGPAGARAASAGFILTIAADVAAMAPGTHIGAAHPVSGGGEKMDENLSKKAAQDVAAYVRTLTTARHRNVSLAEQAVNDSRAFTEEEALNASPPLIDLIVKDVPDLLERLNGRSIRRFDGTTIVLTTADARVTKREMTLRQRVLSAIAHPNIAYLLLSLGMLGLTIELWTPGAILPGVVGGVCLLLAFFALQLLPVNYAGLLLILLGLLFLALEVKVTSFGLLTAGGVISLVLGSMILMDSPAPEFQLSLRIVLPVAFAFAGIAAMLVRLGVAAQRQRAVTGTTGMIGEAGRALTVIGPSQSGRVAVHGEIWEATATEQIAEGARVSVVTVDGLRLTVRPE
jgi:membrane-bound serine protease (ClpP class)